MTLRLEPQLTSYDRDLVQKLEDFVPSRVFDIHVHMVHDDHFGPGTRLPYMNQGDVLDFETYQTALGRWMPGRQIDSLFFGFPRIDNRRADINGWMAEELAKPRARNCRGLALVSPADDPIKTAEAVKRFGFAGLKPYHIYADVPNPRQARIEEFTPEWMWELCHEIDGVLMLHIVREQALADPENIASLRRLCRAYPRCRVVLAHVARSFCYRHALRGMEFLRDLDNAYVDTSAITEPQSIRKAIQVLGPRRVLFGSDYPLSELRGKCSTVGDRFHWDYPQDYEDFDKNGPVRNGMTLIGIESLMSLREACEDSGLNAGDIRDIFHDNARRLLEPHLPLATETPKAEGKAGNQLWEQALTRITGGANLVSKWAERYDSQTWPTYFSRCHGYQVWDLDARRYVDFHGGIGASLLGYADADVDAAVRRRLDSGPFCNLLSPDEVELADLLLELHPWAGRIRYARGGGEGMTVAVRVARAATGRSGVAFCGYHGWHDWYLAANLSDEANLDGHLLPGLQPLGVPRELTGTAVGFNYNDLASFEESLSRLEGRVAAVVMEPMRSAQPEPGFLEGVAARCREIGAVLVFDEVTSGWRFGFPGAWKYLGVEPDIAVYAKAMTNGFPGAAVVGRAEVMDAAKTSFISSTYWTDGIAPAAALACLRKMRDLDVQGKVWSLGQKLQMRLEALVAAYPLCRLSLAGMPAVPTLTFGLDEDNLYARILLIRKMAGRGFLVSGPFFLMYAHDEAVIESMLSALNETLAEIEKLVEAGRVREETGEVRAREGFRRLV